MKEFVLIAVLLGTINAGISPILIDDSQTGDVCQGVIRLTVGEGETEESSFQVVSFKSDECEGCLYGYIASYDQQDEQGNKNIIPGFPEALPLPVFHMNPLSSEDFQVQILDELDPNFISMIAISAERLNPLSEHHVDKDLRVEGVQTKKAHLKDDMTMDKDQMKKRMLEMDMTLENEQGAESEENNDIGLNIQIQFTCEGHVKISQEHVNLIQTSLEEDGLSFNANQLADLTNVEEQQSQQSEPFETENEDGEEIIEQVPDEDSGEVILDDGSPFAEGQALLQKGDENLVEEEVEDGSRRLLAPIVKTHTILNRKYNFYKRRILGKDFKVSFDYNCKIRKNASNEKIQCKGDAIVDWWGRPRTFTPVNLNRNIKSLSKYTNSYTRTYPHTLKVDLPFPVRFLGFTATFQIKYDFTRTNTPKRINSRKYSLSTKAKMTLTAKAEFQLKILALRGGVYLEGTPFKGTSEVNFVHTYSSNNKYLKVDVVWYRIREKFSATLGFYYRRWLIIKRRWSGRRTLKTWTISWGSYKRQKLTMFSRSIKINT